MWYNKGMKQGMEVILEHLPKGWEDAARSEGAIRRSRRIKTPKELLYLVLTYLMDAGSFQNTSVLMRWSTDIRLNKEAVRKRIMHCWGWLKWMGLRLCLNRGYLIEKPEWIGKRRVLLVDASDEALRGSKTSDYRLHYMFDLFEYSCVQMDLSSAKEGERLGRYELHPGDIVIADRIYGTIQGMEHVRRCGADFLLRLRTNAFTLYDQFGKPMDLMPGLKALQPWEGLSVDGYYKDKKGKLCPVRIVATRKDEAATKEADRKLSRTATRKQWKAVNTKTREMASYIVLATSLSDPTAQVLELYRARWQIEQVFRRLKGIFDFGEPPGKNPDSVKAWFYGKLFLAALCEAITAKPSFSPEGAGPDIDQGPKSVAGVEDPPSSDHECSAQC